MTPHGWVQAGNSVSTCEIKSLCHENAKPFERAVATDQLYSLVSPSFVSSLLFITNLFAYSVTQSKLALYIYGKLHPVCGRSTVRNWFNSLTMTVPQFPSGDLLAAVNNDQVLIKKSTIQKDNRPKQSTLTLLQFLSSCTVSMMMEKPFRSLNPEQLNRKSLFQNSCSIK